MAEKDFDLDELLADIDETNIHGEADFGKPVGNEFETGPSKTPETA